MLIITNSSQKNIQINMKISLHFDSGKYSVSIRASKTKHKKHLSTCQSQFNSPYHNIPQNTPVFLSPSKLPTDQYPGKIRCSHKRKKQQTIIDEEYYRGLGYSNIDDLIKENQKLRRDNKALNDYFEYFENKQNVRLQDRQQMQQPVFSFKPVKNYRKGPFWDSNSRASTHIDDKLSTRMRTDYNFSD